MLRRDRKSQALAEALRGAALPDESQARNKRDGSFLAVTLATTCLLKLFLAWHYRGFLSGDDFEIVATAARSAVGLHYAPWNIRSLAHPLILALPVQTLGAILGLGTPRWLTFLACLPTIAFSTLAIATLYTLARTAGYGQSASRAATLLYAFHWLPLTYGATQYPRPISTCLLLLASLLILRTHDDSWRPLVAGMLAGCAVTVRWSEGAFLPVLIVMCALTTKRLTHVFRVIAGWCISFVTLAGAFDVLTWGSPFASLRAFLAFHSDQAANGSHVRVWYWYWSMSLQWVGPILMLLVILSWNRPTSRLWLGVAVAFTGILSLSPLKELRYLQICIPFLCLSGAQGWWIMHRRSRAARSCAAVILACAVPVGVERTLHVLRRKSASAILASEYLANRRPRIHHVVLEQTWAYGEKLYLGNEVSISDLKPSHPVSARDLTAVIDQADAVALYTADIDDAVGRELGRYSFVAGPTFASEASPAVTVFLRSKGP